MLTSKGNGQQSKQRQQRSPANSVSSSPSARNTERSGRNARLLARRAFSVACCHVLSRGKCQHSHTTRSRSGHIELSLLCATSEPDCARVIGQFSEKKFAPQCPSRRKWIRNSDICVACWLQLRTRHFSSCPAPTFRVSVEGAAVHRASGIRSESCRSLEFSCHLCAEIRSS